MCSLIRAISAYLVLLAGGWRSRWSLCGDPPFLNPKKGFLAHTHRQPTFRDVVNMAVWVPWRFCGSISSFNLYCLHTSSQVSTLHVEVTWWPITIKQFLPLVMIYFIKAVKTTPTRCIIHFSCRYLLTVSAGGKVDPVSLHIEVERLLEDISIPICPCW